MKCLSLWQPWASLMVHGRKRVETRGWPVRHRGPLLIHAAKKWNRDLAALCVKEPFRTAIHELLKAEGFDWRWPDNMKLDTALRFGWIVGRVDVVECYPTRRVELDDEVVAGASGTLLVTPAEHAFGDYSPGRFAFLCANPVAFGTPIPYRGMQSLFDVPDDAVKGAA